jgi:WbqC-like protein family
VPVCVISQPRFFPGLHYLHRMMVADFFVILDTVQFSPRHEENRTRLKTAGGPHWLTVPVRQAGRDQRIQHTYADDAQPWRRKAIRTLETLYGSAPFYRAHCAEIIDILRTSHAALTDLDQASWEPARRLLGIRCTFVRASDLPVSSSGSRLLLDICNSLSADVYLSGAFGRAYLDLGAFAAAGVAVRFHQYAYPEYAQRFGPFVPWLSYLDLLFNAGLAADIVDAGGRIPSPAAAAAGGQAPTQDLVPRDSGSQVVYAHHGGDAPG